MAVELSKPKDVPTGRETKVEEVEIKPSENGGFSIKVREKRHEHMGEGHGFSPSMHEPKVYVFETWGQASAFLADLF